MSDSKRIEWIDVAKGVGIVLVSFGHLRNGDGESVWLPALGRAHRRDIPVPYAPVLPTGGAHVQ